MSIHKSSPLKEYWIEHGPVPPTLLQADLLPLETYRHSHQGLVLCCHDVVIWHEGAMLLIRRKNHPAKDILWPIGGRMARGFSCEESLRQRVRSECQLELTRIEYIGTGRTTFQTDPFGHGHGTDSLNLMYVAWGEGRLVLDDLHESPTWVRPGDYTAEFREGLHPYVQDMMDAAMTL